MTDYEVFEAMTDCRRHAGVNLAMYQKLKRRDAYRAERALDRVRSFNRSYSFFYRELRRRAKEVIGE